MNILTSKDGTPIGYTQIGNGPGLILVQGALEPHTITATLRKHCRQISRSTPRTDEVAA